MEVLKTRQYISTICIATICTVLIVNLVPLAVFQILIYGADLVYEQSLTVKIDDDST